MSTIHPNKSEYDSDDALKLAKDVSWVIKSIWSGVAVVVLATMWIVALAADVKTNTEKIEKAATREQMVLVLEGIKDIKESLSDADKRQREIKSQVDRLEQQVEDIEKRDE